ncbi:MAG: fibronectin type III domain-containing protein [Candidatus Nanopelagicales bacterium]
MTDPVVSLDVDRVAVEPGGQASVTIKITNPGSIVEGYVVEVVGEGVREWGEALPPEISIYPQQDANAVIVFSPPGGTGAPGGTWPFGIRVRSTEDPDASAVVEADLEIGKVFGLQAKLLPVNSSGRWRGVHVVQVSNWGNAPVSLRLSAANPDEALAFMIRPDVIELPLGAVATARVWAKTKSPVLRGTPTRIPFTVTGEREGAPAEHGSVQLYGGTPDRPSVDGAFNQKPILSRGTVMVAALALLALVGGAAWALNRPGPPAAAAATFEELGTPDPPVGVTARPQGPDSIEVRWAEVLNVQGYTVAQVLEDGSHKGTLDVEVPDQATTVTGLTPGETVCFVVAARRGENKGADSKSACAETRIPAPTATPPTAGPSPPEPSPSKERVPPTSTSPTTPAPSIKGKWFAAALFPMQTDLTFLNDRLQELKALDNRARLEDSNAYSNIAFPSKDAVESWVLHLGPHDTKTQADASCERVRKVVPKNCVLLQLEP